MNRHLFIHSWVHSHGWTEHLWDKLALIRPLLGAQPWMNRVLVGWIGAYLSAPFHTATAKLCAYWSALFHTATAKLRAFCSFQHSHWQIIIYSWLLTLWKFTFHISWLSALECLGMLYGLKIGYFLHFNVIPGKWGSVDWVTGWSAWH